MTTCSECLSVLSTTRLDDIQQDSAVANHIVECPNCSRLATDMKYAEKRLAHSLASSVPATPPTIIAANTIAASEREHRQFVALWVRRALAIAAGLIVVAFLRSDIGKYLTGADDFQRQSIQISCTPASMAMDAAIPVLRSSRSKIYAAPDRRLITVEGQAAEVAQALARIEQLDRMNGCNLPGSPSTVTNGPADRPGKD